MHRFEYSRQFFLPDTGSQLQWSRVCLSISVPLCWNTDNIENEISERVF
jgi:hypothetical protein